MKKSNKSASYNMSELRSELSSLVLTEGADCSECASTLHILYGFDVFTIFYIGLGNAITEFKWKEAGSDKFAEYAYHVFCITIIDGVSYVIDLTTDEKVIPLTEFISSIKDFNFDSACKFVISKGDCWRFVTKNWKLNDEELSKCQDLDSFKYNSCDSVSFEIYPIWGYTYISELRRYIVVYKFSTETKLISFSVVDKANNYSKVGFLQSHLYSELGDEAYFIGVGRKIFLRDFYTSNNRLNVSWVDENLNKLLRDLLY